jgi:hypothetical protein
MRFKFRNAVLGAVLYLYLFGYLITLSVALAAIAAIYSVACIFLARQFILSAESRRTGKAVEFSQSGAADALGSEWGSFHHVFYSPEPVIEAFRAALSKALTVKCGCPELEEIAFLDVDRELPSPETRTFYRTTATETLRKTGFVFLCTFTRTANVQGVRWWILVSGLRDPNKRFWRYVFAPISVPFIVVSYIRRRYDPLNGLTTIYPGFFNSIDVLNRTREIQFVAFEALVEILDTFGVDTADLKQQKGNILNINVSGGQTSFGSVVQGAMNKVTGKVGGGKS